MAQQVQPTVLDAGVDYSGRFAAIIYNNEVNTFQEVMLAVSNATGRSLEEAYIVTWEAHHYGSSAIYFGTQEVCCIVASIVSSIGVRTEVRPEWES